MLPEAADAPSAKSLIGEDERSEIKFHAASKKNAAKYAWARERVDISWALRKRRWFIILLILINIPFRKTQERETLYFHKKKNIKQSNEAIVN